jgi:hypothetical protein
MLSVTNREACPSTWPMLWSYDAERGLGKSTKYKPISTTVASAH